MTTGDNTARDINGKAGITKNSEAINSHVFNGHSIVCKPKQSKSPSAKAFNKCVTSSSNISIVTSTLPARIWDGSRSRRVPIAIAISLILAAMIGSLMFAASISITQVIVIVPKRDTDVGFAPDDNANISFAAFSGKGWDSGSE